MDFTLHHYTRLLTSLLQSNYSFYSFEYYLNHIQIPKPETQNPKLPVIILRHDVDLLPQNSLQTAIIENQLGIVSSYYFRIVKESNQPEIIEQISKLGHEIGYHYEDLTLANGNIEKAYESFVENLNYFRRFYPVKTICMHGSPTSKWDSRDIWKKYNYRNLGIIGEPYFDIDFNKAFYLTDTGRRWDGWRVSVRDKMPQQSTWNKNGLSFHSTSDIILSASSNTLPPKIMITIHPQRWTNKPLPWIKELLLQTAKNVVKRFLFVKK